MGGGDVIMAIPWLARSVVELDEPNPSFCESASHEALAGKSSLAVHVSGGLGFLVDVEGIRRFSLHPIGELKTLNSGFQNRIVIPAGEVLLVEALNQVELLALVAGECVAILDILNQLVDVGVAWVDIGACQNSGKEAGLPVLSLLNGISTRSHRDEARQILVFSPKAIEHP